MNFIIKKLNVAQMIFTLDINIAFKKVKVLKEDLINDKFLNGTLRYDQHNAQFSLTSKVKRYF